MEYSWTQGISVLECILAGEQSQRTERGLVKVEDRERITSCSFRLTLLPDPDDNTRKVGLREDEYE